ncbi:MAG: cold-shock protein [Planctomycetota bacterium]|jgi:CspA family cold shock protein
MEGTVKWYNQTKGYGFISPSDGGKDVFVHATVLEGANLHEGDKVEFEITESDKGPKAANVRRAED